MANSGTTDSLLAPGDDNPFAEGGIQPTLLRRCIGSLALLLMITAALAVWKWDIVRSPPYEEQAVGLWSEASFLVESGFDYYGLRFEQHDNTDKERGPPIGSRPRSPCGDTHCRPR